MNKLLFEFLILVFLSAELYYANILSGQIKDAKDFKNESLPKKKIEWSKDALLTLILLEFTWLTARAYIICTDNSINNNLVLRLGLYAIFIVAIPLCIYLFIHLITLVVSPDFHELNSAPIFKILQGSSG